jgi:hypothetical protein
MSLRFEAFSGEVRKVRVCGGDAHSPSAMMQAAQAQQRAAYAGSGMIMNAGDLEALEDGESISGVRYTNVTRFSRVRGGW